MPTFRLLHCTDLHLADEPYQVGIPDFLDALAKGQLQWPSTVSSFDPDLLDAMASFAYEYRHCYDAMVLSGDLATTGSRADLTRVRSLVDSRAASRHLDDRELPTVGGTGKPILLIPGNHDRFGPFWGWPPYGPGHATFDEMLRDYWSVGADAAQLWHKRKDDVTLVLVGADLTLARGDLGEKTWGYLGQGRAYGPRIESLRRITRRARAEYPNCVVLWVVHFEPDIEGDLVRLLDQEGLRAAVQAEAIPALLCGHGHLNKTKDLAGTKVFVCGTTTQFYAPDGNYLDLIELDVSNTSARLQDIRQISFRYDEAEKQFVAVR